VFVFAELAHQTGTLIVRQHSSPLSQPIRYALRSSGSFSLPS